ncbi:MAG: START domain-containing protein [Myxococcota bacterium]
MAAIVTACRASGPTETPTATAAPSSAATDRPASTPATGPAPSDDEGWESVTNEDGIIVTARASARSELKVFRGVGVVEAPLIEVLAVITDADRHDEWVHSCSESGLIEQSTELTGFVYNRTATPWPVADRDVVLRSRIQLIDGEREVLVTFTATEHPAKAPEDGVIRMPYLEGHYHLWAQGPSSTRVEYQVDSDPGGRLPTGLVSRGTRDMPVETLQGLRAQVVRTRGSYAEKIEDFRRTITNAGS